MLFEASARRVITFYSFKGGTGRTMALANVAWRLAHRHGLNVIAVDWDLEAPGLGRFFGFTPAELAAGHGVLDFFTEWRERVSRNEDEPPDARPWLLPVTREQVAPAAGSLSLLGAGRMDEGYGQRLAEFGWRRFYEEHHGAQAVETLRAQLVESADLVLIDSRTGLTDPGGVCAVQLPDGVVLLATPSAQSIEGIERVARAIRRPDVARAERPAPMVWVVLGRIHEVEETVLTEQWLEKHAEWFEAGIKVGLWARAEHPRGLGSHRLPERARWSFGESLLTGDAVKGDLLAEAYEHLTDVLYRWSRGDAHDAVVRVPLAVTSPQPQPVPDIESLSRRVAEAEARGDMSAVAEHLVELGEAYTESKQYEESVRVLERAVGMLQVLGDRPRHLYALLVLASAEMGIGRPAQRRFEAALRISEELGVAGVWNKFLTAFARLEPEQPQSDEALALIHELANYLEDSPTQQLDAVAAFLPVAAIEIMSHHPEETDYLLGKLQSYHHNKSSPQGLLFEYRILWMLMMLRLTQERFEEALSVLHDARTLCQRINIPSHEAHLSMLAVWLYSLTNDWGQAVHYAQRSVELYRDLNDARSQEQAEQALAQVIRRGPDKDWWARWRRNNLGSIWR
jgi:cellulose biosynthesis protein BcsQ